MKTLAEAKFALLKVTDEQWSKLVEMLTYSVLELNARKLKKVEMMYRVGHYPAMHFRLTTISNDTADGDLLPQVSGFRFALDQDIDDEVYIEPLSPDGFWEDYLLQIGITHVFTTNEVGVKKLYKFIDHELKLWENNLIGENLGSVEDEWRELKVS